MSLSDDLTRLSDLHRNGQLSDDEFARAKARLAASRVRACLTIGAWSKAIGGSALIGLSATSTSSASGRRSAISPRSCSASGWPSRSARPAWPSVPCTRGSSCPR